MVTIGTVLAELVAAAGSRLRQRRGRAEARACTGPQLHLTRPQHLSVNVNNAPDPRQIEYCGKGVYS